MTPKARGVNTGALDLPSLLKSLNQLEEKECYFSRPSFFLLDLLSNNPKKRLLKQAIKLHSWRKPTGVRNAGVDEKEPLLESAEKEFERALANLTPA